jgi:hypothetical protein
MNAINRQMSFRIGTAQERLQKILGRGNLKAMETEVVAMVRKGEVDESLILLIEANIQQAEAAGALPAAKVLRALNDRIKDEKERSSLSQIENKLSVIVAKLSVDKLLSVTAILKAVSWIIVE